MTKKIIAVSLVILLVAVSFVACGKDKGYLLSKDENGFEHAYVTDTEGNTVLNENGDIRVYETNQNGEIATDENGNKKENSVKMPEVVKTDKKYQSKEFIFNIPSGWKIGDSGYVAASEDDSEKIQIDNVTSVNSNFNELVAEAVYMSKNFVDKVNEGGGKAEFNEGTAKVSSNQIDAYYIIFYAEITNDSGEKQTVSTTAVYFKFEGRNYKAFYQTNKAGMVDVDYVVQLLSNLTMNSIDTSTTNTAE